MVKQGRVVLTLDKYEHSIMIHALNELRNGMLEEKRDPGAVEDVLLKTIEDLPENRLQRENTPFLKERGGKNQISLLLYRRRRRAAIRIRRRPTVSGAAACVLGKIPV